MSPSVPTEAVARKKVGCDELRPQVIDNGMVELEGMIGYCTKPRCRRKHVLEHFGEQFDATTQCQKTCDFCKNPEKVERDTNASECMPAVVNSRHPMHASNARSNNDENICHRNPLESNESQYDSYESDGFLGADEGFLGISENTGDVNFDANVPSKTNGFVNASTILRKYEVSAPCFVCLGLMDSMLF